MNSGLGNFWLISTIIIGTLISFLSIFKDIRNEKKISTVTLIIIGLIIISSIIDFLKNKEEQASQKKDKVEVIDAINKTHDLIGEKEFPGFTIEVLVKIEELKEKKRKYIFDFGNDANKNRISLYLDFGNNLVYSIVDNDGVPHTIKVPQKIYTFEFNTLYFINCEFGDTEDFNFMRLSINNNHFNPLKFNTKLELPDNYKQKFTLLGDIERKDSSRMKVLIFSILDVTFSNKKMETNMNITDKYIKDLIKSGEYNY